MIRTDNLPRKIPIPTLLKFKIKKDGPYEFVLEEFEDKIIITGIFEGGIIYKHGGPKVGDELLDVNNIKIKGKSLAKSVEILEHEISDSNRLYIEFTLYRDPNLRYKEMNKEKRPDTNISEEELEEEVTSL